MAQEDMTFKVPAERLPYLKARIAKLQRRVAALVKRGNLADVEPIGVRTLAMTTERYCESCQSEERFCRCNQKRPPQEPTWGTDRVYYICEVTGTAPHLDGYEFIATLQHEKAGTILRTVPTAEIAQGELDRFRLVAPHCEHCKVSRKRKDSFVVRATETGTTIQVGRNCLGKYIGGGASPKSIGRLAELLIEAQEICDEPGGWGGENVGHVVLLPEFLVYTAASIRLYGWVSKGKADAEECQSTSDHVWDMLFPWTSKEQEAARAFRAEIADADRDLAVRSFVDAGTLVASAPSDYEWNLLVALRSGDGLVNAKRAGLVASLISWHERRQGHEIARKRAAKVGANSEHFGAVKERVTFDCTVTRIVDSFSEWGDSHGHFFETSDGNVAVWWTGSRRLDVGAEYTVTGTVKKHDDYKGVAQTVLLRCKIVEK